MAWLEDKVEKWRERVAARVGPAAAAEVLAGAEALGNASPEGRAAWSCRVMARLADAVPDQNERAAIMTERSCVFVEEFGEGPLDDLRALYRKTGDVDAVLSAMAADADRHGSSRREGNDIIETKVAADAEACAKALTPYERQVATCYCPLARAAVDAVPPPYCYCGAGWYKGIWEYILQRPLRVEVLTSVLTGGDACTFRVYLPPGTTPASPP